MFHRQEWDNEEKEVPSQVQVGDKFGHSVAIFHDTVIVGAYNPQSLPNEISHGSVYIYTKDENGLSAPQVLSLNGEYSDRFGWSVAIFGDTAVIGDPYHHDTEYGVSGAVYIYERNGDNWVLSQNPLQCQKMQCAV